MKKSKIDVEFQGGSSSLYLPEEIMLKILTPLPAKSIGRWRCVSKKWRHLLSDPSFIRSHLNLSLKNRRHKALVLDKTSSSFFVVDCHGRTTDHDEPVVSATQRIKFYSPNHGYLVLCCSDHQNGLILVGDQMNDRLFLLNPTTRECTEFPKSPCHLAVFGIGNNKAVAVNSNDYSVYVYTFKSNTAAAAATSWKRLQIQNWPGNVHLGYNTNGVLLNGSIYWLGFTCVNPYLDSPALIAFDLTEETIRAVPIPVRLRLSTRVDTTLGVLGGSLCIIRLKVNMFVRKLDVWVRNHDQCDPPMEKESSWTKLSFRKKIGVFRVIFLGNAEFILISESTSEAVIYNITEKSSRDIVVVSEGNRIIGNYSTFVDSLVSPRQLLYRSTKQRKVKEFISFT